jgi:hypothetical protein
VYRLDVAVPRPGPDVVVGAVDDGVSVVDAVGSRVIVVFQNVCFAETLFPFLMSAQKKQQKNKKKTIAHHQI